MARNGKPRGWPSRRNDNDFFKKEKETEHTVEVGMWSKKVCGWVGVGGKKGGGKRIGGKGVGC